MQGGSITFASMVPIIIVSLMFDVKWGLLSAVVYAIIQIMMGFYPPPTQTFGYFVLVVLLDYVFAFGVLGLAAPFYKLFRKKTWAIPAAGCNRDGVALCLPYRLRRINLGRICGGGTKRVGVFADV